MASFYCSLLVVILSFYSKIFAASDCPYGRPTINYKNEVFVFLVQSNESMWVELPWNKITTIALFMAPDTQLTCLAHFNNVRVVKATSCPIDKLTNATERRQWVTDTLDFVKTHNLDGVNIDFEDPIPKDSTAVRDGLTALVSETVEAFHSQLNGSQVTFDVAWSHNGIDGRFYDYANIAKLVDFIFVMSYDEQSQIHDVQCTAKANSPYDQTVQGVIGYLDIGIPTNKVILGVPWYGYKYECLQLFKNNTCQIKKVPFRGCNCSDAAGSEVPYPDILQIFRNHSISKRLWDDKAKSPYFNFKINGTIGQIRYDDPESLKKKYQIANDFTLKGVGMWTCNFVDYSPTVTAKLQREEMWNAIPYSH